MLGPFRNILLNPQFTLTDYGVGPFTSGFCATRWKIDGAGAGISFAPGLTSSNGFVTKWLRGRPCMDITVDASTYDPTTNTKKLRQRVYNGARFGESVGRMAVVAFGPEGGSFDFSMGGRDATINTLGNTVGGTPRQSWLPLEELIPNPSQEYLTIEAFKHPADISGTYKLVLAQMEFLHGTVREPSPFELRPEHIERLLCSRFLWPCPRGYQAISIAGGTQIVLPMSTPVEMNDVPGIILGATVDWKQLSNGTVTSTSSPTSTGTVLHNRGGRVVIGGFSGLAGANALGQVDSDSAFLLEAELG